MWQSERAKARQAEDRAIVKALAKFGFHYRTIARCLYGSPSKTEIGRVGRYAKKEGVSSLTWRRGDSPDARLLLGTLRKNPNSDKPVKLSAPSSRLRLARAAG